MNDRNAVHVAVKTRILRPVEEVFDAVVDPKAISGYFTSHSSGPLEPGTTVEWQFADMDNITLEVTTREAERPRRLVFEWPATGEPTRVEMTFDEEGPMSTVLTFDEREWPRDDEGIQMALGQTRGWTEFGCFLKAYLEHGIRLRQGASTDLK